MTRLKQLFLLTLLVINFSSFASTIDPEYKDDTIKRVSWVFKMPGALTLDSTAINAGANSWNIDVRVIELQGQTTKELDWSWGKLIQDERTRILYALREVYPDIIPPQYTYLSNELIQSLVQLKDIEPTIFIEEGVDHPEVRKWLITELQTELGRRNTHYFFRGNYRKPLSYWRYHFDDQSAGIFGDDILFIRGVKKVIIIRIAYAHA